MSEKVIFTIIIFIGGILLTIARRWKNSAKDAGYGVTGWTIFIILCTWFEECNFLGEFLE